MQYHGCFEFHSHFSLSSLSTLVKSLHLRFPAVSLCVRINGAFSLLFCLLTMFCLSRFWISTFLLPLSFPWLTSRSLFLIQFTCSHVSCLDSSIRILVFMFPYGKKLTRKFASPQASPRTCLSIVPMTDFITPRPHASPIPSLCVSKILSCF